MLRRFIVTTVWGTLLLAAPMPGRADTEDPIDSALDAGLASDQGQTDAGMIACTQSAIKA